MSSSISETAEIYIFERLLRSLLAAASGFPDCCFNRTFGVVFGINALHAATPPPIKTGLARLSCNPINAERIYTNLPE
jgi:hypothetical protein